MMAAKKLKVTYDRPRVYRTRSAAERDALRWRVTLKEPPTEDYRVIEGAWAQKSPEDGVVNFVKRECYQHKAVGSMEPHDQCWHLPIPAHPSISTCHPDFWRPQRDVPDQNLLELLPDRPKLEVH